MATVKYDLGSARNTTLITAWKQVIDLAKAFSAMLLLMWERDETSLKN